MNWSSPAEFFAMGGYGPYVWSSFGMCALLFLIEPLAVGSRNRAILRLLRVRRVAEQYGESVK